MADDNAIALDYFRRLESTLRERLIGIKPKIIEDIEKQFETAKKETGKSIEREGLFTKEYLKHAIKSVFSKAVVEGPNQNTMMKRKFFGSTQDWPDFEISEPITAVGETKYRKLSSPDIASAIGRTMLYMAPDGQGKPSFDYGCVIFFDTASASNELLNGESQFKKQLWDKEKIFLIVI